MIRLRPFRAWRPAPDKAHLVASRSYVSYTDEKIREKLRDNPYSFLHVIHADIDRGAHVPRLERFLQVRRKWNEFVGEGYFIRDEAPAIYLYEQRRGANVSRGIVAAISVADYRAGKVKVHEHTLQAREELFKEYLQVTGVNAEPVLLASPDSYGVDVALERIWGTRPAYDFTTTDMARHRLWVVDDPRTVKEVLESIGTTGAVYIADGHHRLASSARLAEATGAFGDDPRAWCLAFIVPQEHLQIRNFDRAVTSLGGMDTDEFLAALRRIAEPQPLKDIPILPPEHGHINLCTRQGWFTMPLPTPTDAPIADRLDAEVLSRSILGPVLGIHDLRTDPHVRFVPGTLGAAELDRLVKDGEAAAAFNLRPVSFAELKAVADSGGCMPPKSTYIEPKLRSGLTVYSLEDQ